MDTIATILDRECRAHCPQPPTLACSQCLFRARLRSALRAREAASQVAALIGAEGARSQKTVCRPCDKCSRCTLLDKCEHYPY